jgi:hypothetical protein
VFIHYQIPKRRRVCVKDCLNTVMYNFEGTTKMRKINVDGMNEIKYALRYNHKYSDVFAQPGSNEMSRRGVDRTSKITELMINCLCSLNCSRTCSIKVRLVCATDRCRAAPKMMNRAQKIFARNGVMRWKKRTVVL